MAAPQPAARDKADCTSGASAASAPAASHREVQGKAARARKAQAASVEQAASGDKVASAKEASAEQEAARAPEDMAELAGTEAKAAAAAASPAPTSWTTVTPARSTAAIGAARARAHDLQRARSTVSITLYDALSFLFETEPLVQTGVAPNTIDVVAVAGITGRVVGPDGLGLSNVSG
ncbi:MAG: hypothetical protein IPG04_25275 [Polyangiaceae bacterium]|nr:hypothetical protein [Polyangiaceae bacterium]